MYDLRIRLACTLLVGLLAACQPGASTAPSQPTAAPAPAAATGFDRAATLTLAATARDVCTANMPDSTATRRALVAAGIPAVGTEGTFWLHSPAPTDLLVATSIAGRTPLCFIAVRGMTAAEARTLIQPWLDVSGATPAQGLTRNGQEGWSGRFAGGPVSLVVLDDFRIPGYIRGRAIGARAR